MTSDQDTTRPTKIQAALKLEDMPAPKWQFKAARTATGTLFVVLGAFLIFMLWHVFTETKELNLPLLIAGPVILAFGAHIASGEIVGASLASLREPLRVIRELWKGPNA